MSLIKDHLDMLYKTSPDNQTLIKAIAQPNHLDLFQYSKVSNDTIVQISRHTTCFTIILNPLNIRSSTVKDLKTLGHFDSTQFPDIISSDVCVSWLISEFKINGQRKSVFSKNIERDEQETISLISSLPSDIDCDGTKLFKYQTRWYDKKTLQGILNFQRGFEPQETDIIIASFPKSGTTWLKALTVALLERSKHSTNHPLLSDNPHGLVPVLELRLYTETSKPDLTSFSSTPRLFSTHVPYQTLQEALKNTPCKVVYVWRNVKDALVSLWYFECANLKIKIEEERSMLESMFESFCRGVSYYGPFWEHVLSYWRGSLEDSKNVLFLRYEELKIEPRGQLKKLAEFLGVLFSVEEEESGCVEEIIDLCSLRNLKNLEVNKTGKTARGVEHKNFFRKGEVGDSKNYLTPEMERRIDMIVEERFRGADLKF